MRVRLGLVLVMLTALLAPAPVAAQLEITDTISLIKADESPSNGEIAGLLSDEVFETSRTVVIGRDDVFADSLASGVLQADAPLLLVPSAGPVPADVHQRMTDLGVSDVILLGGEAAVSAAVETELASRYQVVRRSGQTRFETAIAIAEAHAPEARTAILARAFPAPGATDPTQGFADALAAGGLSAMQRWPVLLTDTATLSPITRDYLTRSAIDTVLLVGGTAAVSLQVEEELRALGLTVERIAGSDRFETAIAVAAKADAESAADVARVTLVEGQSADAWAGGFAAAAHAARFDAPIVLVSGQTVPAATTTWLSGAAGTDVFDPQIGSPVLLCVTDPVVCESGRQTMGLPPAATVVFDPPSGSVVATGQRVDITMTAETYDVTAALVTGTCIEEQSRSVTAVDGRVTIVLDRPLPDGPCNLLVTFDLPNRAIQRAEVTYQGSGAAPVASASPTSVALSYSGGATLGVGSLIEVGFDQPVLPRDGDIVLIGDLQGDEVQLTCGTDAVCSIGGQGTAAEGLSLQIEVTGAPQVTQPRSNGVIDLGGAGVVITSTIGNDRGGWNVAASGLPGGERVFGTLDPSNAVLPPPIPEPLVSASAADDMVVVSDPDCSTFGQFDGLRVHSQGGDQIGVGDGVVEGGACVGRSTVTRDLVNGDTVLVVARKAGTFVPSRTVEHVVGTRTPPPPSMPASSIPVSTSIDLSMDSDGILGAGDRITIQYTDQIAAPGGTGIRVIDHQGDEARIICSTHATCSVNGSTLVMTLTTAPELVFGRGDSLLQLTTYVAVVDSSLGNNLGNWNLPASGLPSGERVFGTTNPTNAVLRQAVDPAGVTVDVSAGTVTISDPSCLAMGDSDTARVFNAAGNSLGAAGASSSCVATVTSSAPLSSGQTLYVVIRQAGPFTLGRTTVVTVP